MRVTDCVNRMKWSFVKSRRIFVLLGIFSLAMGILEAIVVVYLRAIYYPQGFEFPLSSISPQMLYVEFLREIATIIMLVTLAAIAGKNSLQKLSYFLYSFAIWDISYYIWLKQLLNWPPSFLTWDLLFLIPVAWIAPVLAPIVCSLTMILLAGCLVCLQERGYAVKIKFPEWGSMMLGAVIIFCTFIWDYSKIIVQGGFLSSFWTLAQNDHFQQIISQYKPTEYNWYLFALGEICILSALALIVKRTKTTYSETPI